MRTYVVIAILAALLLWAMPACADPPAPTPAAVAAAPAPTPAPAPVPTPEVRPFGFDFFDQAPSAFAPLEQAPVPLEYRLGPGDLLKAVFWSRTGQETTLTPVVTPRGNIHLPLVGLVPVSGLTLEQAERTVIGAMKKQFPHVDGYLTVDKVRSIQVYVTGEARRPGGYTLSALSRAFHALYAAGGPNARGSMRKISLVRRGRQIGVIDLYQYLLTGDRSTDLSIENGDTLQIPVVGTRVEVRGGVKRPAIYETIGPARLREAMELAGGLLAAGYLPRAQVRRVIAGREMVVLDTDLGAVLNGPQDSADNLLLQDGDAITVPTVLEEVGNIVSIGGHIRRPGDYQFKPGMRVKDLVEKAEGLPKQEEVHLARADLFRVNPDRSISIYPFHLGQALGGDDENNLELLARDRVVIYTPQEVARPREVSVRGPVKRPGRFFRQRDMKVWDLVFAAGGLNFGAHLQRADLLRYRTDEIREAIPIDLEACEKDDPDQNLVLQDRDELVIYSVEEARWRDRAIFLDGAIQRPGPYQRTENMRLSDLIFAAGGSLPDAAGKVEVARVNPAGETAVLLADLKRALAGDQQENLPLQDRDRVNVPRVGGFLLAAEAVALRGEVKFPGTYALKRKGETLGELVRRAGGLTAQAFPQGAVFVRRPELLLTESQQQMIERAHRRSRELAEKEYQLQLARAAGAPPLSRTGAATTGPAEAAAPTTAPAPSDEPLLPLGRVPVDLAAIMASDTKQDVPLQDGDQLLVPRPPTTVVVLGAVLRPGPMQHQQGRDLAYYISRAGGCEAGARRQSTVVVRANGEMLPARQVKAIGPGDAIYVPPGSISLRPDRSERLAELATSFRLAADAATVYFLFRNR